MQFREFKLQGCDKDFKGFENVMASLLFQNIIHTVHRMRSRAGKSSVHFICEKPQQSYFMKKWFVNQTTGTCFQASTR